MRLKPFLLDMWLDAFEHNIEFNLAASEGPRWTLNEILSLAGEDERQRFLNHDLVYSRPAGAEGLRAAIAEMQGVDVETVQVVTGASEALLVLMWLAFTYFGVGITGLFSDDFVNAPWSVARVIDLMQHEY